MKSEAIFAGVNPPAAIGAPVMALGIFGTAALQKLPASSLLTPAIATLAALVWAAAALAILVAISRRGVSAYTAPTLASFGIGTWVAATVVVARLLMLATPMLTSIARALFLASTALLLWFLPLAIGNLARLASDASARASGSILLTTVATQAVAILALRLFADVSAVRGAAAFLIGLGLACYAFGLMPILRRYWQGRDWRLAEDWDNTNCILHGALSISGLAAAISGDFPMSVLVALWFAVVAAFVAVESIELLRLVMRVNAYGLSRGVFVYDVSQWARNFTFGMFYAFTLAFAEQVPRLPWPLIEGLRGTILQAGSSVVLALLLAETLVMLWSLRPQLDPVHHP